MKYMIVLGDGMADEPLSELQGKTPVMAANTPTIDMLAKEGEVGLVSTIPEGMSPGSDTANLSVIGYDPKKYYTGRSPLEALSIGVDMKDSDISFRCNIVTLSEEEENYQDKKIIDHSSGEITTEEAAELLEAVKQELEQNPFSYYLGTSYRHLLIWNRGEVVDLTPPHDVLGQTVAAYLPKEAHLRGMMERSYEILVNHPVNVKRKENGLNPANSIWFWGAGTKPGVSPFEERTGKKGAMISAVDLLKGIAIGAKMRNIHIEGANGTLHTNYQGKAEAAVKTLLEDGDDFVYVHVEAPDEMGHQGSIERKIQAIEYLDERIIRPIKEAMDQSGEDYRMLILPDHPTPIRVRTHTSAPVPYLLYDSTNKIDGCGEYSEAAAKQTGRLIEKGHTIIDYLFQS